MDHAVKATRGRPWNKLRFENDELECLYQRYTLKLQRFSVTGVVALVVVLCGVMAALSLTYTRAPTLHVSIVGSGLVSCCVSVGCGTCHRQLSRVIIISLAVEDISLRHSSIYIYRSIAANT